MQADNLNDYIYIDENLLIPNDNTTTGTGN